MHPKLERAMPLLEHLASGGIVKKDGCLMDPNSVSFGLLIASPERYTIHREPRELFVNHYDGGWCSYATAAAAASIGKDCITARYVEDLTWKPS